MGSVFCFNYRVRVFLLAIFFVLFAGAFALMNMGTGYEYLATVIIFTGFVVCLLQKEEAVAILSTLDVGSDDGMTVLNLNDKFDIREVGSYFQVLKSKDKKKIYNNKEI